MSASERRRVLLLAIAVGLVAPAAIMLAFALSDAGAQTYRGLTEGVLETYSRRPYRRYDVSLEDHPIEFVFGLVRYLVLPVALAFSAAGTGLFVWLQRHDRY